MEADGRMEGQVRDEKASLLPSLTEGSFLLIFGFLFPLPFVDVVVTHPALHSLRRVRPPPCFWLYGLYLASLPACLLTPSLVQW